MKHLYFILSILFLGFIVFFGIKSGCENGYIDSGECITSFGANPYKMFINHSINNFK